MRGVGLDLKRRPRFIVQGRGQGDIKALGLRVVMPKISPENGLFSCCNNVAI